MTGLAPDGGLFMPSSWPVFSPHEIAAFAGRPYAETAAQVMRPFVGASFPRNRFEAIVGESYAGFQHAATCPLVQIGPGEFVVELFHGPTLAFKDVAMQLVARMMDECLAASGGHATVLGATSGDTGAAATGAFAGRDRIDLFMLYPEGRIADAQRRQMTTSGAANIHVLAVEGDFDTCQRLVKTVFADRAFVAEMALTAVNSINWARIMAQVVYYFTAAASLGAPGRDVAFAVPTGNFGDIFAGYVAARMGLPVERLIVATNENDILQRALASGVYEPRVAVATSSCAMDIQVSSNFERLLFEVARRDAGKVASLMTELAAQGRFEIESPMLDRIGELFAAERVDEAAVFATIAQVWHSAGYLVDPHTAVAVAAGRRVQRAPGVPLVALATAHPAKFPESVEAAVGFPAPVPARLAAALAGEERGETIAADAEAIKARLRLNAVTGERAA